VYVFVLGTPAFALPAELAALPAEKKVEMAESYYLAGLQYREVGKDELADGHIALAFRLNPDLDPEAIVDPQPRDITPPELTAPAEPADTTGWTSGLVVSQLLRLASAFLAHDADAIVSMLDGSVYVAGMNVTRSQAHAALDALFEQRSLTGISLAQIYDTDNVMAQRYEMGAGVLADAFQVTLDARMDLSADVPFWGTQQRFVLRPVGDTWLVSAILFSAEHQLPANWSPAPMESAADADRRMRASTARNRDIADRSAVAEAVIDGADRFLEKDTDGVLAAVDNAVRLPDGSSATRESLRTMLNDYFGRTPYRALRASEVITLGPVERLDGDDGSPRYRVEVSFGDQYQEAFPSIRSGQSLDLRDADGRWVVFAIS
jgi:hypothetical protein